MKYITEPAKKTPVAAEVDVAVLGGGPAGLTAALAAARNGAQTLLIERYGVLGGLFATTYANYPGTPGLGMSFQGASGKQVVGGIGWEMVERLIRTGGATGKRRRYLNFSSGEYLHFPYALGGPEIDPESLKTLAFEMAAESGVRLMLHTTGVDVIASENSVTGIIVQNKSGRQAILAKVIIDASADADLAAAAGAAYEQEAREKLWRLCYGVLVGNVNNDKVVRYIHDHPEQFPLVWGSYDENGQLSELYASIEQVSGDLRVTHNRMVLQADHGRQFVNSGLYGIVDVNASVQGDPTDVWDLTQAEILGRKAALENIAWLRKSIPGYEHCRMIGRSVLGTRESRRIVGEYTLTEHDLKQEAEFPDSIGLNHIPLDMHVPGGGWEYHILAGPHEIPYRCLLPKAIENLLVAGRCISCAHIAQSSLRKVTACMVTGQAAGTAAALSLQQGITPRKLDYARLQEVLREQGGIVKKMDQREWS